IFVPFSEVLWIALLGTLSGLMIGCIGIGGVILVPALVFLAGVAIQIAIPAAMFAYILSGLVATVVFARNKSIEWRMATSLCIGGTPAAFAGAWAVSIFDGRLLAGCLGLLTLLSGINSLRPRNHAETDRATLSHGVLFFTGAATGFLSSLTGTGGPLLLVPILLSMRLSVLASVGLSQIFQLPVAIAATAGNIIYGKLDLALGLVLAASLSGGSWFGAKLAHAVPRAMLRGIVSGALVIIGLFILVNVGWRLIG
ncbi:MAG: sulfite exporter TauE/SafE family protein, partial [Rhizobiales bacterium]|nr:sulfite exporter TauE/SafE family protein [Hyphomicrobiales bacterium]